MTNIGTQEYPVSGEKKFTVESGTYIKASAWIDTMTVHDLAVWLEELRTLGVPDNQRITVQVGPSTARARLIIESCFPEQSFDDIRQHFATTTQGTPFSPA